MVLSGLPRPAHGEAHFGSPRRVGVRGSPGAVAIRPPGGLVVLVLFALLGAALLFAAAFGAVQLRPDDLLRMTLNHVIGARFEASWRPQDEAIFFAIRLPRVAGAAIVGAALASAGVPFQGLLRNPLADPYALGVF